VTVPRALQDTRPGDHEQKATELLSRADAQSYVLLAIGEALVAVAHELRGIKAQRR
jgi:diphthamide biosynthesis methyltransferase